MDDVKRIRDESGAISFGSLFFLLLIGIGIYVGVKLAVPWVRFQQVEALFKDKVVRLKVASEEEVRAEIDRQLEDLGVSFGEEGYQIVAEKGQPAVIEGTYIVFVNLIGGHGHTYVFNPRGEAPR